ncbi:hypothetical protein [Streptomyces achmelvichensis]|uniref:hypothetical protein n=1 Tax=Streptomyces achmelvichensis TaxID=3134111 RepID=UPI003C12C845
MVTTLTDPRQAPAAELAALYAERWEAENTLAELKTSQIGHDHPLPSKSPELVRQEIWAHLAVHAALRALIWRTATAREQQLDCDRFSFSAALRAVRRSVLTPPGDFPPPGQTRTVTPLAQELMEEINPPRRLRSVVRQIKRMLPKYPAWRADRPKPPQPTRPPAHTIALITAAPLPQHRCFSGVGGLRVRVRGT